MSVYEQIKAERDFQDQDNWGRENDETLSLADWLLILERRLEQAKVEQLLHACRNTVRGKRDIEHYGRDPDPKKQILKIAAIAVAALETLPQ